MPTERSLPSTTLSSRKKGTSGNRRFVISGLCSIMLNGPRTAPNTFSTSSTTAWCSGATSALLATGVTRGMAQLPFAMDVGTWGDRACQPHHRLSVDCSRHIGMARPGNRSVAKRVGGKQCIGRRQLLCCSLHQGALPLRFFQSRMRRRQPGKRRTMKRRLSRLSALALSAALAVPALGTALACTRTLYVGADNMVITGRNMDWIEDMASDLWVFPAGLKRDGAAGPKSVQWTSKYGSVVVSAYEASSTDGLNEKGLVANLLYLAQSDYGKGDGSRPFLSIMAWPQFVLDNYASVAEAVEALRKEPFQMLAPALSDGTAAALHLGVSDSSGASAVFEYLGGKLTLHHGKQYTVMTNSPIYDQQLAIDDYWKSVGGEG